MEKTNLNQENQIRKQILELGPLILFFIGNYFSLKVLMILFSIDLLQIF